MTQRTVARHPGTVLKDDFMIPEKLTIYRMAKDTGLDRKRTCQLVCGYRRMTKPEATLLSRYFAQESDYFVDLQTCYDVVVRAGI